MPVLNEEAHLADSVAQVLAQYYPGKMEVILALGPSQDRTNQVAGEIASEDDRIILVDNPKGFTPVALNLAIDKAQYPIIVRVDAHGELAEGYICRAVELLQRTGAANVGGLMDAQGVTAFEKAVAAGYNSKLGLGGGSFHLKETPEGPAETVFLGCFRAEALNAVGGFDETLHRAQDWDLNYRLIKAGYRVWFSPDLQVTYRPRSSVKALAKQFFKTGQWRREVIRRNPDTIRLRYLAPPVAVLAISVGLGLAAIGKVLGVKKLVNLAMFAPLGYLAAITAGSVLTTKGLDPQVRVRMPMVLTVMHLSWGAGFLIGVDPDALR